MYFLKKKHNNKKDGEKTVRSASSCVDLNQ